MNSDRDLFDTAIHTHKTPLEETLIAYDQNTFAQRLQRIEYLYRVFPDGYGFAMDMSTYYLFDEARRAFINGEFVGTLLLTQAFIEHWLQRQLESRGYIAEGSKQSLSSICRCLHDNDLLHPFLLDRIDELRKLRNPLFTLSRTNTRTA